MWENIQLHAQRYFLGVPIEAPIDSINGDFGWMATRYRRYIVYVSIVEPIGKT